MSQLTELKNEIDLKLDFIKSECNLRYMNHKYENALDILQTLLNAYGCKTKLWEPARALLDAERPLIPVDK